MNILFVLPVLSDSYYQKRIYKMSALGVKSTVLGFERDHYKGKSWSIPTDSLGYLEHGNYIRRLGKLLKAFFKIRSNISTQEALYAFNLDILLICWAARLFKSKKIKLIYDIADIRSVMVENGLISVLLRSIERLLVKRTSVVVVSSPAYIDGYFKDYQNINQNFAVIENKVDKDLPKSESLRDQPDGNKDYITIGYFGMLRLSLIHI